MRPFFIEQFPNHPCELKREERFNVRPGKWEEIRFKIKSVVLISHQNVRSHIYLRSRGAIELEKLRQIRSRYWYIVHPFSEFRHYWELVMCFILLFSLFLLPFQNAFLNPLISKYRKREGLSQDGIRLAMILVAIVDCLWMADVFGNFLTGYHIPRTKQVISNPIRIIQNYFFGYFLIHFFTGFPIDFFIIYVSGMECYFNLSEELFVTLEVFNILKLLRLQTFVSYFNRVCEKYSSSHLVNRLILVTLTYCMMNHWAACLCFLVPQLAYGEKLYESNEPRFESSWIRQKKVMGRNLFEQYMYASFHAVMNIVGVGSTLKGIFNLEDQLVATVISVLGRWYWMYFLIIFLQVITTTYASRTKFFEILHQIKEYMMHRQLPEELQKRLTQFYRYRFQTHYFKERVILGSMSENLRKEIILYTCHKLIENTEIFHALPKKAIESIVQNLKCEVFLPNDVIIQADGLGDCMYFVASGTATAYTTTGKEICNFKDGDYFGELALILEDEKRTATIIATEITELYKLQNHHFWQIIVLYPEVFSTIEKKAFERYEATLRMDERYSDIASHMVKVKKKSWKTQSSQ